MTIRYSRRCLTRCAVRRCRGAGFEVRSHEAVRAANAGTARRGSMPTSAAPRRSAGRRDRTPPAAPHPSPSSARSRPPLTWPAAAMIRSTSRAGEPMMVAKHQRARDVPSCRLRCPRRNRSGRAMPATANTAIAGRHDDGFAVEIIRGGPSVARDRKRVDTPSARPMRSAAES